MKKLLLLFATLFAGAASGQLTFSYAPQPICHTTPTTYIYAGVVTSPSATSFSWAFPGAPSGQMFVSHGASNGYSVAIANTAGPGFYTITCTAYLGTVTTGFSSQVVQILPSPTVSAISNPATMQCPGSAYTLVASGAMTYTWLPGSFTGANFVVNPFVSSCYTVTGVSANGCIDAEVVCVNVFPMNSPNIAVSTNTVCKGSSVTLTASVANSYTWSSGANTQVTNFIPLFTTFHTVSTTDTNGCVGTMTAWVQVDTTCADVWPGDANSDGTVDGTDVLELGLNFNNTGAVRTPGGNTYVSQQATAWTGVLSNGKNRCHADCNGSGTVDANDTMAVYLNWNQNHAFRSEGSAADPALYFAGAQSVQSGTWAKVDVMLGTATSPATDVYGVSFDVTFPVNMIEAGSLYLLYGPSFMSADGANLHFRRYDMTGGVVNAVRVRTNGSDLDGNGKIAELHFKVKNSAGDLVFGASNVQKISAIGVLAPLTAGNYTVSASTGAGLTENSLVGLSMAPNPASDKVVLSSNASGVLTYNVSDLSGRIVKTGTFSGSGTLDISDLASGTYAVSVENGTSMAVRKLVIIH